MSPAATGRVKYLAACEQYSYILAIANGESFGHYSSLISVLADEEFRVLVDINNNIEIKAKEITLLQIFRQTPYL